MAICVFEEERIQGMREGSYMLPFFEMVFKVELLEEHRYDGIYDDVEFYENEFEIFTDEDFEDENN